MQLATVEQNEHHARQLNKMLSIIHIQCMILATHVGTQRQRYFPSHMQV